MSKAKQFTEHVKKPIGLPPVTKPVGGWNPRCLEPNPRLSGPPRDALAQRRALLKSATQLDTAA